MDGTGTEQRLRHGEAIPVREVSERTPWDRITISAAERPVTAHGTSVFRVPKKNWSKVVGELNEVAIEGVHESPMAAACSAP